MPLLFLSATLIILSSNVVLLRVIRRTSNWSTRQTLHTLILVTPLLILGLGICSFSLTSHGSLPVKVGSAAMGAIASAAFGLGMMRLILTHRFVARRTFFTCSPLEQRVDALARQIGVPCPRISLFLSHKPIALTCGIRRPMLLLSSWMVEYMDDRELEAVIVHELAHIARQDFLMIWLATMLRDAFFYFPTSWIAYRHLLADKERACDDLTVGETHHPLALASALAKVWLQAVYQPKPARVEIAQALTGSETPMDERIQRLLASPTKPGTCRQTDRCVSRYHTLQQLVFPGACLLLVSIITLAGCSLTALVERVF